jgi:hypothetical protein
MFLALLALTACAGCREEPPPPEYIEDFGLVEYDILFWNKMYNVPVVGLAVAFTDERSPVSSFRHAHMGIDTIDANGRIKATFKKLSPYRNGIKVNVFQTPSNDTTFHYRFQHGQPIEYAWEEINRRGDTWKIVDTVFVELSFWLAVRPDDLYPGQKLSVTVNGWKETIKYGQYDKFGSPVRTVWMGLERYTQYDILVSIETETNVLQQEKHRITTGRQNSMRLIEVTNQNKN